MFPLNMPWAGDWYLWCVFALFYNVAYFNEPMVCYRQHPQSMTTSLMQESRVRCREVDITILLTVRRQAEEAGFHQISRLCLAALAEKYGQSKTSTSDATNLSLAALEDRVWSNSNTESEKKWFRAPRLRCNGELVLLAGQTCTRATVIPRLISLLSLDA